MSDLHRLASFDAYFSSKKLQRGFLVKITRFLEISTCFFNAQRILQKAYKKFFKNIEVAFDMQDKSLECLPV